MRQLLPVRLVLLRPRTPENLGAAARAIKNFGLSDWAVVDPHTLDFGAARRVAVHAEELLDRPRLVATLDEAVADCSWVVGTSSRRIHGKRRLTAEQAAREALQRASSGRTAIVFGDERDGLTNDDVARCHDLSVIPTEPQQPSLNLAQALLVYCYELHRAAQDAPVEPPAPAPPGATEADLGQVEEALRQVLSSSGFITGPERHAVGDLLASLQRSRLSRREARLWNAALRSVASRLRA